MTDALKNDLADLSAELESRTSLAQLAIERNDERNAQRHLLVAKSLAVQIESARNKLESGT